MFKEQWDRVWPIFAGAILVVAFLAGLFGSSFFETLCGTQGDCARARDWIGALSGWGAVVAAVWTIAFIQRQIADENRRHREILALELHPKLALARRARMDSGRMRFTAKALSEFLRQIESLPSNYEWVVVSEISPLLRILTEIITGTVFDDFEREIGSLIPFSLDEGRQNLKVINPRLDTNFDRDRFKTFGNIDIQIAIGTMTTIIRYCNDCEQSSVRFEEQWKALIS
jgi:hypothetical protein